MKKWADYLISEVNYDSKHLISVAIRHQDTDKGITVGIPVDRLTISSDIKNGLSYTTIYHGNNSWKKGKVIQTFFIDGTPYLRLDENKVNLDYLGDLPNSSIVIEEPTQELESLPEPAVETAPSSKGSLPKESAEELPQELELLPEPAVETAPSSKGSLPKGYTAKPTQTPPPQTSSTHTKQKSKKQELEDYENDYMKRMERQRIADDKAYQELVADEEITKSQQVRGSLPKESAEELPQELELLPEPAVETAPSSKGSLPKESAEELPQELELLPEPAVETQDEEVTPEQLSQVNNLEQQIDELEDILFSQLDPTSEGTPEQLSKIKELEKEIEKLETVDLEHEIIQTLQNQNEKLDNIEKKLSSSTTKKSTTKKSTTSDSLEAYCVKCKTKRKIKNPTATVMKNGRDAVKGSCSTCDCNVFRIGKMKK